MNFIMRVCGQNWENVNKIQGTKYGTVSHESVDRYLWISRVERIGTIMDRKWKVCKQTLKQWTHQEVFSYQHRWWELISNISTRD